MDIDDDEIRALRDRVSELKEALRREQTANNQFKALLKSLTKIENSRNKYDEFSAQAILEDEFDKLHDDNIQLRNHLTTFLREYYPKQRSSFSLDISDLNSGEVELIQFIQEMLNTSGYVEANRPEWWPPYVELLLRAGIIEKHPENSMLIRLVDTSK